MAQQCLFIAVVDDDAHFCAQMQTYLEQAAQSLALTISVECFTSPLDFVSDYSAKHDILFLDIEMPDVDGLSVARRIRQMDNSLCIIFVTSMAQYAIQGYEVSALDFVVKPVAYTTVANKLQKAALYCESRRDTDVMLSRGSVAVRVRCSEIFYIEKEQNYLVYHTQGEEFRQRHHLRRGEPILFPWLRLLQPGLSGQLRPCAADRQRHRLGGRHCAASQPHPPQGTRTA